MANWLQVSHHDARTKFVAQFVRMFGSIRLGGKDRGGCCTRVTSPGVVDVNVVEGYSAGSS